MEEEQPHVVDSVNLSASVHYVRSQDLAPRLVLLNPKPKTLNPEYTK
jgi:hypothetical protein